MSKGDDREDENKKGNDTRKIKLVTEGISFITCPIHNIKYPKGRQCPNCATDKK